MLKGRRFFGGIGQAAFDAIREQEMERNRDALLKAQKEQEAAASELYEGKAVWNVNSGEDGVIERIDNPWSFWVSFRGRKAIQANPTVLRPR
ncbi:MAG: hypothetical protein AAB791_03700 [Patescibacteria group bacterium]